MEIKKNGIYESFFHSQYAFLKFVCSSLKCRMLEGMYKWFLLSCALVRKILCCTKQNDNELIIVFGSQTGTAEEYAYRLSDFLKNRKISHSLLDGIQLNAKYLQRKCMLVFIVSTCGEGEPPDNVLHVFSTLREYSLYGMRCPFSHAIFGIGDSSYTSYNEAAVTLSALLHSVRSDHCHPLVLADTSKRLDDTFQNWMSSFVASRFPKAYRVKHDEIERPLDGSSDNELEAFALNEVNTNSNRQPITYISLETSELLTPHSSKITRLLRFNLSKNSSTNMTYEPGDHLGCFPPNATYAVNEIIRILSLGQTDLRLPISDFLSVEGTVISPTCSVYCFLIWHADFHSRPCLEDLQMLAKHVRDGFDSSKFEKQIQGEFFSKNRMSWLQILDSYSSLYLELKDFLLLIPRKKPRLYSICNYSAVDSCLSITVAAVEGGLCSQWLCSLEEGDKIPVFVRKSDFRISFQDFERDVLFVGTGTGVAPFLGFLQKKHFWKYGQHKAEAKKAGIREKYSQYTSTAIRPSGELILIFGCRTSKEWIFSDRIRRVQNCQSFDENYKNLYQPHRDSRTLSLPIVGPVNSFILNAVYVAHSREHPFQHVQSYIKDIAESVWKMVSKNGIIFICGDALKMCHEVEECLVKHVLVGCGGFSYEKANLFLNELKQTRRIRRDVWDS